ARRDTWGRTDRVHRPPPGHADRPAAPVRVHPNPRPRRLGRGRLTSPRRPERQLRLRLPQLTADPGAPLQLPRRNAANHALAARTKPRPVSSGPLMRRSGLRLVTLTAALTVLLAAGALPVSILG